MGTSPGHAHRSPATTPDEYRQPPVTRQHRFKEEAAHSFLASPAQTRAGDSQVAHLWQEGRGVCLERSLGRMSDCGERSHEEKARLLSRDS